jgi:lactoylglutathione lyase
MLKFIKFAELPVADQERALRFYTEKLGFRVVQNTPYKEDWRWIELALSGGETAILLIPRDGAEISDRPRLVLAVDDVTNSYLELQAKGVQFTQSPTRAPWTPGETFSLFRDSEGNTILIGSDYEEV